MIDSNIKCFIESQIKYFFQKNFYLCYESDIFDRLSMLVKNNDSSTIQALTYLQSHITKNELDQVKWKVKSLMKEDDALPLGLIAALGSEIYFYLQLYRWQQNIEKYNTLHPLFYEFPDFSTQSFENEMLSSSMLQVTSSGNTISVVKLPNKKYAFIDETIPQNIMHNLIERELEYFIRINPHYVYDEKPLLLFQREIYRRPSPKWNNAIGIKPNESDGFVFYIPNDIDIETNSLEFIDRNHFHVFRLEGYYQRDKNGYFTMMVEELQEFKHPFKEERYIIGRMIHLDSNANGNCMMDATLNHIDLAINLYIGDTAIVRDNNILDKRGNKVFTPYRTHILRIENTKLSDIILLSTFFQSQYLQNEWIEYMFRTNQ